MAHITFDPFDPREVQWVSEIVRKLMEDFQGDVAEVDSDLAAVPLDEEGRRRRRLLLLPPLRELLKTKTGRLLIEPFARSFDEPASLEDVAEILPDEGGIDRRRKAHSLFAGLGRWEVPRGIRIFEAVEGRPRRYRMNDDVRAAVERILEEAAPA